MTTVRCSSCDGEIDAGDGICPHCGASRSREAADPEADERRVWAAVEEKLRRATAGKYRVRGLLGAGGMAAVYLADDVKLRRKVAIKVMSPALMVDPRMVRRFTSEATTTAQFRHPNIVTVFDVDEAEGLHFFAMTFIGGRSLETVIEEEGPLPTQVVRLWLGQVASALAYAHDQGVVHRDVKPSNILIDDEGQALVADFGIAKLAHEQRLTRTGMMVGTPAYMGPEQLQGAEATPASDQYALGVVGYEMLTGAPPVTGTVMAMYQAHASGEQPAPLTEARPDCPSDLAETIHRMLAKKPEERLPSLRDARAAIGPVPLHDQDAMVETLKALASSRRVATTLDVATLVRPLRPGEEAQLAADPRDATGRVIADSRVTWESSDPTVLAVDEEGVVKALRPGSATLVARSGTMSAAVPLEVRPTPAEAPGTMDRTVVLSAEPEPSALAPAAPPRKRAAAPWVIGGVTLAAAAVVAVALRPRDRADADPPSGSAVASTPPSPAASVAGLTLVPGDTVELVVGESERLEARVYGSARERIDGVEVAWESTDARIARVSTDGVVDALAAGMAEVRARVGGSGPADPVSASTWIVVSAPAEPPPSGGVPASPAQPPRVVRVVVSPAADTLRVGERLVLAARAESASGQPVAATDLAWSVSDPRVARVDGMGTGVTLLATSPGEVTLEATTGTAAGSARLVVVPRVTALLLSPDGGEIAQGRSVTLRVTDQDGAPLDATFASRDPSVAALSASGALRGVTPGEVTVVVSAEGLTLERSFTVTAGQESDAPQPAADRFRSVVEVDRRPRLATSQAEVQRVTNAEYPPLLRENGIGGTVVLRLYLDTDGEVVREEVSVGSGRDALDEAAVRVARALRFEPAMAGGEAVRVYIDQPIHFEPGR